MAQSETGPAESGALDLSDESITAEDVRLLRQRWPGVPIVTYVNTSAAVKAESDICCTSGNARKVVESLGVPRVIMLPDEYLAQNIARETNVEIISWAGHCEVHERFSAADVRQLREVGASAASAMASCSISADSISNGPTR